jgi:hypothetical protein
MGFFGGTEEGKISDFRAKYPQYDDLDDETLAGAVYKKFYSDLDEEEFRSVFLDREVPPAWSQKEAPAMDWEREDDQFATQDLPDEPSPFQEEAPEPMVAEEAPVQPEPATPFEEPVAEEMPEPVTPMPEEAIQEPAPPTDLSDFGVTDEQLTAPAREPREPAAEEPPEPPSPEELAALGFVRNTMDDGYEPGWWSGTARHTLGTAAAAGSGMYKLAADALDNVNSLYKKAAKEDSDIITGARDWLSDEGSKAQIQSIYNRMIADYSSPENAFLNLASQGIRAIPDMAAVVATTALTRNPNAGYAVMGAQVFSDTYGRSRYQEDKSIEHAFYDASAATAYELGGEKAFSVLEPIAQGLRGGKQLLMTSFNEGLSEVATEGLTIADELTRGGKEFEGAGPTMLRLGEAGFIGLVPGAGMHVGGNVIQRINNKMNGLGFNTDQGISDEAFEQFLKEREKEFDKKPVPEVLNLDWEQTTEGAAGLDLRMDIPIDQLPVLEEQDPRTVIRQRSHKDLMNNPAYKRFYDASDIGELSGTHEERVAAAKEAYIRKAEKIKKWKPIVEETTGKEADFEIDLTGENAAVEFRRELERLKEEDPDLPDGYDPAQEVLLNMDGEETGFNLAESARVLAEWDKRSEKDPNKDSHKIRATDVDGDAMEYDLTREERDQIEVQIDEYRKRFDAEETLESPRSEEREGREIVIPQDETWGSTVEEIDPDQLKLNPELMQYKSGTDAETGRNKQLEGVKTFDPSKAGIITAWQDVNGETIVADGHQRVNLLKELKSQGREVDTKILTRVYREDQGFSAEDVRTIAAEINIAQGTGTAIDAAKVMRQFSDAEAERLKKRLPVNSSLVRDAVGLSKLGEEAFQVVVNELIEPKYGAMVGEAFEESEQTAAMQIIIKSKPATFAEAYAMIADIKAGGFVKSEQGGLFGEVEMESLIKERAQILSAAESKLKKNVTVFNALTKEEKRIEGAGNVLDTEANKKIASEAGSIIDRALRTINTNPELNNELNRIAKEFKDGSITKTAAANQFVEAARAYSDGSRGELADKPGDEGPSQAETGEPSERKTKKKKTIKEVEIEVETVTATGEPVKKTETAYNALTKIDKRIDILEGVLDCVKA